MPKGKKQTIIYKSNRHQVNYESKINYINLYNTYERTDFPLKDRDH